MIDKKIPISKKNFLLLLYLLILALIGPMIYWLNESKNKTSVSTVTTKLIFSDRLSLGSKILVTADTNVAKQEAVNAFSRGDYDAAAEKFALALKLNSNDPEALIYRNNAVAIARGSTYKIGLSVPIGGNLGVAKEILRGVAQAQNQINQAGGINGKLVAVEIANDDNNPEIAEQVAKSFTQDPDILAVIGHNDSNASVAAAPVYQQKGLVMITPTSSADVIPTMGTYIFRTTPNSRALAGTLADYAVNTANRTNIAVCIDSDSAVSKSFKEEFIWSIYNLGAKIIQTKCDLAAPDFLPSRVVSQAISDGADAILIAPSVKKANKAVEIAQVNDDRLTILGTHGMVNYNTLKKGQKAVNGMVSVVAWHPTSDTSNSFTKEAQKLWGGSVNWRTAMAHDAAQTIFAGLKVASNRDQLQQVLASPQFVTQGATETISFLPSGDRNMKGTMVKVQPGKLSGTGFDFVSFSN